MGLTKNGNWYDIEIKIQLPSYMVEQRIIPLIERGLYLNIEDYIHKKIIGCCLSEPTDVELKEIKSGEIKRGRKERKKNE